MNNKYKSIAIVFLAFVSLFFGVSYADEPELLTNTVSDLDSLKSKLVWDYCEIRSIKELSSDGGYISITKQSRDWLVETKWSGGEYVKEDMFLALEDGNGAKHLGKTNQDATYCNLLVDDSCRALGRFDLNPTEFDKLVVYQKNDSRGYVMKREMLNADFYLDGDSLVIKNLAPKKANIFWLSIDGKEHDFGEKHENNTLSVGGEKGDEYRVKLKKEQCSEDGEILLKVNVNIEFDENDKKDYRVLLCAKCDISKKSLDFSIGIKDAYDSLRLLSSDSQNLIARLEKLGMILNIIDVLDENSNKAATIKQKLVELGKDYAEVSLADIPGKTEELRSLTQDILDKFTDDDVHFDADTLALLNEISDHLKKLLIIRANNADLDDKEQEAYKKGYDAVRSKILTDDELEDIFEKLERDDLVYNLYN